MRTLFALGPRLLRLNAVSSLPSVVRTFGAAFLLGVLTACGGGSNGPDEPDVPPVTITGRISFDRFEFNPLPQEGLNVATPTRSPARHIVVEAIDSTSDAILASTTTDELGDYTLSVPADRSMFVRAKAQMLKTGNAPTWSFRVLDNTFGDALYTLDGSTFDSGTGASTQDLHAPTGWGGSSYTATRTAAPFAILDAVFRAKELILSAAPNAVFPDLDLFWSEDNRTATPLCPDAGNIGTTFYQPPGQDDRCNAPTPLPGGIYVLGAFAGGAGDTDEFDQHVIAHEFGHYVEDQFGRSDSLGGDHGGIDRLDLRVAFGEGWGNAFSAMALDDPEYRDSMSGVATEFNFDFETDDVNFEGWYSELSVSEVLWDIYDDASEPGDLVALGFLPIWETMIGPQITTDALTSIFSFSDATRGVTPESAPSIDILLANEHISGTDEFGSGETNNGGDPRVLEIYRTVEVGAPLSVCTDDTSGSVDNNKLGNRKFLRFVNATAQTVTIQASGAVAEEGTVAATDPDIIIFLRGDVIAAGTLEGQTETISQVALGAGTHIIEIYDFDLQSNPGSPPRCMTVSIAG